MMLDSFIDRFGAEAAAAITDAAISHENGVHDNRGSDPFRWALLIALGYQCLTSDSYRTHHKIAPLWAEIDAWLREEPQRVSISEHDGDMDYIALMVGVYSPYVIRAGVSE